MTDTFRAMCAELVDAVDLLCGSGDSPGQPSSRLILTVHVEALDELADRARALLAQPVAEEPTDEELLESAAKALSYESIPSDETCSTVEAGELLAYARAVLARFGGPTPQPVPVSERLPGPEDCDEQERCWMFGNVESDWRLISTINPGIPKLKYCFSHWLPANALPTPEAKP